MAKVLSSSKVLDDRGREFPTVRIAGTQVWDGREQPAELPKELAEACAAAVKQFQGARLPRWSWTAVIILGGAYLIGWSYWSTGRGQELLLPLIFPSILLVTLYRQRQSPLRRPYDERVLATLIAAERCASCGYPLSAAPENGDGTRTCSECGASWLVPSISLLPLRRPGVPDPVVPERELPVTDRLNYADGRGRAVWIVDPAQGIVPAAWGRLSEVRQARILSRTRARGEVERIGLWSAAALTFGFGGLQLWISQNPARTLSVFVGIAFVVVGVLLFVKALRFRTARDGESIARIFLLDWVCPSCATPFADPREEPDGCITCPSCRAAWRVKGAVAESPGTV